MLTALALGGCAEDFVLEDQGLGCLEFDQDGEFRGSASVSPPSCLSTSAFDVSNSCSLERDEDDLTLSSTFSYSLGGIADDECADELPVASCDVDWPPGGNVEGYTFRFGEESAVLMDTTDTQLLCLHIPYESADGM